VGSSGQPTICHRPIAYPFSYTVCPLLFFISTSMTSFINIVTDCDDKFATSAILFRKDGYPQWFLDWVKQSVRSESAFGESLDAET
jgi:hypothetical protein